jgi:hypothetical protein
LTYEINEKLEFAELSQMHIPVESGAAKHAWSSEDGLTLAYTDACICRVKDLQTNSEVHAFHCDVNVTSIWGSKDGKVLATGLSSTVIVWCLSSAARLLHLDCTVPLRSISGFGSLNENNLSIVVGVVRRDQKGNGVHIWHIQSTTVTAESRNEGLFSQTLNRNTKMHMDTQFTRCSSDPTSMFGYLSKDIRSDTLNKLVALEAKHKAVSVSANLVHEFPTREGINCIWVDSLGDMLAFGTVQGNMTIYKLDDLEHTGPSLKMLKRSRNLCADIHRYMKNLGTVLLDGTLLEWLISNGMDTELQQILRVRPSSSLLLLSCGVSALELAVLMRASRTLELLLWAAVEFATHGEPKFNEKVLPSVEGAAIRLVPPAMRRVTSCIQVALQSVDMAAVAARFLHHLGGFHLNIPVKFLPRSVKSRFQGSRSPSVCRKAVAVANVTATLTETLLFVQVLLIYFCCRGGWLSIQTS